MDFEDELRQLDAYAYVDRLAAATRLAKSQDGIDALLAVIRDGLSARAVPAQVSNRGPVAITALAAAAETSPGLRSVVVDLLSEVLLTDGSSSMAWTAADQLAALDHQRALHDFGTAAERTSGHESAAVAHGYVRLLTEQPHLRDKALYPLLSLLGEAEGLALSETAQSLALIDDDRAFDALLDRLVRTSDAHSVIDAAVSSPRAPSRQTDLCEALAHVVASGTAAQYPAARALAATEAGVQTLLDVLDSPGDVYAVVRALAESKVKAAVPALLRRLESDAEQAGAVIEALGQIGDPEALPSMASSLRDSRRARQAALALACFGEEGLLELIRAFESPDPRTRAAVQEALTPRRDYRGSATPSLTVVGELISLLQRGPASDIARIARVLGWMASPEAIPALRSLLPIPDPQVRLAAMDALHNLPAAISLAEATALLADPLPIVRAALPGILPDDPTSYSVLRTLLDDPHPEVRTAATQALQRRQDPRTMPLLVQALGDEDVVVQLTALQGPPSGSPAMVDELAALVSAGDAMTLVREYAARALARSGELGRAVIFGALDADDDGTRAAAARAAGELGRAGVTVISRMLDDPSLAVRRNGLHAVAALVTHILPETRWVVQDSRRGARANSYMHAPADSADTIADVAILIRKLGNGLRNAGPALRRDYASALLQFDHQQLGDVVAQELVSGLRHPQREVVEATAAGILESLGEVDVKREPLPGWCGVATDGYVLHHSRAADAVLAALFEATRADAATASLVAVALGELGIVLDRKRTYGLRDFQVSYFSAPSTAHDDKLLASLSEVAAAGGADVRFLDATFMEGQDALEPWAALREGTTYELEIAVRVHPTGIPASGTRPALQRIDAGGGNVELLVVLEAGNGFTVDEAIKALELPPSGDSVRHATFSVRADRPSFSEAALAELGIRVFYEFNLLEMAVIRAEIVSRFRDVRSQLGLEQPITLEHRRIERGFEALKATDRRDIHIDVRRLGAGYSLQFTWTDRDGTIQSLPTFVPMTAAELAGHLRDARDALLDVTMNSPFADTLTPPPHHAAKALTRLARVGRDLHTALFCRDRDAAIAQVGRLLARAPLPRDSIVQVSVEKEALDFFFPWGLLYEGELPTNEWEAPEAKDFWGERYAIEQRLPGRQHSSSSDAPLPTNPRMALLLWESFENATEHVAMLTSLRETAGLALAAPITGALAAQEVIRANNATDIFYFYTHAHTRDETHDPAAWLESALAALPAERADQEDVRRIVKQVSADRDEPSNVKLSKGRLRLRDLYADSVVQFTNSPVVFLNACESAQLTPALTGESFVHFFLNRGASAFIGTECTMTIRFAHPFAEYVLKALLDGSSVGRALLMARRHFLGIGNPLGLGYTLYGDSARNICQTTTRGTNT